MPGEIKAGSFSSLVKSTGWVVMSSLVTPRVGTAVDLGSRVWGHCKLRRKADLQRDTYHPHSPDPELGLLSQVGPLKCDIWDLFVTEPHIKGKPEGDVTVNIHYHQQSMNRAVNSQYSAL